MKTTLTLTRGSFYFLNKINLIKGIPSAADLALLSLTEVKGLKTHVKNGSIKAEPDIIDYRAEDLLKLKNKKKTHKELQKAVSKPYAKVVSQNTSDFIAETEEQPTQETLETMPEMVSDPIEKVSEPITPVEPIETPEGPITGTTIDYRAMLKDDLKGELDRRGIAYEETALKDSLIAALIEDDQA